MTNHEIALELTKLVHPNIVAVYSQKHKSEASIKQEDIPELVAEAFNIILSRITPQDGRKETKKSG